MTDNMTENMNDIAPQPVEKPDTYHEPEKLTALADTVPQPVEKPDTYHEPEKLTALADTAGKISWLFLALGVGVALIIFYLLYLTVKGQIGIENFFLSLPSFLIPLILALFFWIASRLVAEGVYVLMDIEDNTRKQKL